MAILLKPEQLKNKKMNSGLPLENAKGDYPGNIDISPNTDNIDATMGRPELTYILAGPPRLLAKSIPAEFGFIGITSDFNISDNLDVMPIKALGTERNILISSQSPKQISVSKFLFSRESLLRSLLTYYLRNTGSEEALKAMLGLEELPSTANTLAGLKAQVIAAFDANIANQPSITLTNYIARAPIGLMIITVNKQGSVVLAKYAEGCKIQNLNEVISSGSPVIQQSIQLVCDRILPVDTKAIKELTGIAPGPAYDAKIENALE